MELPSYFEDFLPLISPTSRQKEVMVEAHRELRERLMSDEYLKKSLLSTFIQGSHRRATAIQGSEDHPCDVDIVAVTNLPRSRSTAAAAHKLFQPFLERHYPGRFEPQDRSWCISVDREVKLDLVPTSEPDSPDLREAIIRSKNLGEWTPNGNNLLAKSADGRSLTEMVLEAAARDKDWDRSEPLWIPDRIRKEWEKTHPLYLISWSAKKNLACNGHFGHVVKALKWWRRHIQPTPKYPKGYPLEHLIGECCPDGIGGVAEGVTRTLETMASAYADHAHRRETPFLPARGVTNPEVDVMHRVLGEDFAGFHANVVEAARIARAALDADSVEESARLWRDLLGDHFPEPPKDREKAEAPRFTTPSAPAKPREGRFA